MICAGAEHVEPIRVLRTEDPPAGFERGHRHHLSVVVADVELADAFRRGPLLPFSLQEDAPLPPEPVELVHIQPAEERLHRLIDIAESNTLFEHLVAVDVDEELRDRRAECRVDIRQLGPLLRRGEKFLHVLVEELDRAAAAVLQPEREAALRSEPGNRRRHRRENRALWNLRPAAVAFS